MSVFYTVAVTRDGVKLYPHPDEEKTKYTLTPDVAGAALWNSAADAEEFNQSGLSGEGTVEEHVQRDLMKSIANMRAMVDSFAEKNNVDNNISTKELIRLKIAQLERSVKSS